MQHALATQGRYPASALTTRCSRRPSPASRAVHRTVYTFVHLFLTLRRSYPRIYIHITQFRRATAHHRVPLYTIVPPCTTTTRATVHHRTTVYRHHSCHRVPLVHHRTTRATMHHPATVYHTTRATMHHRTTVYHLRPLHPPAHQSPELHDRRTPVQLTPLQNFERPLCQPRTPTAPTSGQSSLLHTIR